MSAKKKDRNRTRKKTRKLPVDFSRRVDRLFPTGKSPEDMEELLTGKPQDDDHKYFMNSAKEAGFTSKQATFMWNHLASVNHEHFGPAMIGRG